MGLYENPVQKKTVSETVVLFVDLVEGFDYLSAFPYLFKEPYLVYVLIPLRYARTVNFCRDSIVQVYP